MVIKMKFKHPRVPIPLYKPAFLCYPYSEQNFKRMP